MPVFCWVGRGWNLTPTQQKADNSIVCQAHMLSLEECKKHIGHLNLDDKQVEEIRSHLTAFVEAAFDSVFDSDTLPPARSL